MKRNLKVGDVFYTDEVGTVLVRNAKYVVEVEKMCGGGTGMFTHDTYPDGHHVLVRRLSKTDVYDSNGSAVKFYQSGCFNCVVEPEKLIYVKTLKRVINFVEKSS